MNEIFIFAQTRSGSTLLQRAINQTPGVLVYGEHGGFLKGYADAYYATNFGDDGTEANLRDPNTFAPCLSCIDPAEVRRNMRTFLYDTINPFRSPRWGFKEVRYRHDRVFDLLSEMFPQAKFIFLIRNPLEQVESIRSVPWGEGHKDIMDSIIYWRDTFTYFEKCVQARPMRCKMIEYNNLRNVKKLFSWLEINNPMSNLFKEMPRTGQTEKKTMSVHDLAQVDRMCWTDYARFRWG